MDCPCTSHIPLMTSHNPKFQVFSWLLYNVHVWLNTLGNTEQNISSNQAHQVTEHDINWKHATTEHIRQPNTSKKWLLQAAWWVLQRGSPVQSTASSLTLSYVLPECQRSCWYLPGYLWKVWPVEWVRELAMRRVRCIHRVTGEAWQQKHCSSKTPFSEWTSEMMINEYEQWGWIKNK